MAGEGDREGKTIPSLKPNAHQMHSDNRTPSMRRKSATKQAALEEGKPKIPKKKMWAIFLKLLRFVLFKNIWSHMSTEALLSVPCVSLNELFLNSIPPCDALVQVFGGSIK